MIVIPANNKIKFRGVVETFLFPANKIKTYHDYLMLGGSRAFPTFRDIEAKKIAIKHEKDTNLVVNLGLGFIRDFLLQEGPAAAPVGPNTNSVGSGTNAPDAADTGLQTQIARLAITEWYPSGLAAKLDTFWSSADGNGAGSASWNETGIHNHISNASTLFCRKKFLSTFTKDNTKTALIAWTLTPVAV